MSSVDVRVVEMRFDNKQFESGVKTSMSTLDKLKSSLKLDGANSGMNQLAKTAKSLDFSNLNSNVQSIADRFSTMGVVGMEVLKRLTNAAIDLGKKITTAFIDPIFGGGFTRASNIETAKFAMEGLGVAWKDIEEDIDYAVSGTAYSLDAAAKAASSLVASGVQFGKEFGDTGNSPMAKALRGISGIAAQTSSDYEGIANIFTTVAGQGRLMAIQLNQLATRGMNASATLADYFNNVNSGAIDVDENVRAAIQSITTMTDVTEADIREMVSDGLISFDIFSNAMDDTFGEHAKDANKTFTGAMSNIKAALARIGAGFVTPLIDVEHNATNLVGIFNAIREKINEVKKAIDPIYEPFSNAVQRIGAFIIEFINRIDVSPVGRLAEAFGNLFDKIQPPAKALTPIQTIFVVLKNVAQAAKNVFKNLVTIGKALKDAFVEVFNFKDTGKSLIGFSETLVYVTEQLLITDEGAEKLKNTFKGVFTVLKLVKTIIGKLVTTALKILAPVLAVIGGAILDVTSFIGENIVAVKEWADNNVIVQKSLELISSIIDKVVGSFSNLRARIIATIDAIKSSEGFYRLTHELGRLWEAIKKIASPLLDKFANKIGAISGEDLEIKPFEKFVNLVSFVAGKIADFLEAVRTGTDPLSKFVGKIKEANSPLSFIAGFLEKAKNAIKSFFKYMSDSTDGLSPLEKLRVLFENFKNTIVDFFNNLSFGELFEKFKTGFQNRINKIIETLGAEELAEKLKGFFEKIFEKIKGFNFGDVIKYASAIFILLKVISAVRAMGSFIKTISKITNSITGFFDSLGKAAKNISNAVLILGLAGAMILLAKAMEIMAKIPSKKLEQVFGILAVLIGEFIGVLVAINKAGPLASKNAASIGIAVAGVGAGLWLIADTVKRFAEIEIKDVIRSGLIITSFIGIIATATKLAGGSVSLGSGLAFLGLAVAVNLLIPPLKLLAKMKWDSIKKGVISLGIVLAELGIATRLSGAGSSTFGTSATLIAFAVALNLLIPALILLGKLPLDIIKQGGLVIAGLLLALGGAVRLATGGDKNAFKELFAMCLIVVASAGALIALSLIPWNKLLSASIGLSMTLLSIAGAIKIASDSAKAGGVLSLTIVLAEIVGAFKVLSSLDIESLNAITASLSAPILAIAVAIKLLSKVDYTAGLNAAVNLSEFLIVLSGLLMVLGGINELSRGKLKDILAEGDGVLAQLGHAIGNFIGSFVGGFGEGTSNSLPKIATNLSDFMTNLKPFLDGCAEMASWDVLGAVGTLVAVFIALNGADFINSLDIFGGLKDAVTGKTSIDRIGSEFVKLGGYIKQFSDSLGTTFDSGKVESASAAALTLAEFANNLPNSGGKIAEWFGDNTIEQFGEGLVAFAPKFAKAAKWFQTIDTEVVEKVSAAAQTVTAFAKSIPNTGGKLAEWIGDNTLEQFGEGLAAFAPKFAIASKWLQQVDKNVVEKAMAAAQTVTAFAETIPNQGGKLAELIGDNTLAQFGEGLAAFGPAFSRYSKVMMTVNPEIVERSQEAAKSISAFADTIPDQSQNTLRNLFTGDSSLASFATGLSDFGHALFRYYSLIKDIEFSVITSANYAYPKLIECVASLANVETNTKTLRVFGNELDLFGGYLSNYYIKISEIDFSKVDKTIEEVYKLIDLAVAMEVVNADVLSKFGVALENLGAKGVDGFVSAFTNGVSRAKKAAGDLVSEITATAINSFSVLFQDFYYLGMNSAIGYERGIKEYAARAAVAAWNMVIDAYNAAQNALDSHSPSRKFEKLGVFSDIGLINGMLSLRDKVYDAGYKTGESSLDGLKNAIYKASSVLEEDTNLSPTITPVLDLTNIKNGAGLINGFVSTNPNVSLGAVGARLQNGIDQSQFFNSRQNELTAINTLERLRESFEQGIAKIQNMQMVLDTGEFVGATTSNYSEQFAINARRVR